MEETLRQAPANCLKIVFFGPESTGKTTLATELATHFETEWVPEYMRDYLQEKWDEKGEKICWDDLIPIARGQIASENSRAQKANKVLFCDTDLRELQVYSEYYNNGKCPSEIRKAVEDNHYDLYFLTFVDTPWVPDDLRDNPEDRLGIFRIFENELKSKGLPYHLLRGTKEERIKSAIELTEKLVGR
jgi:NadR type nicotinamide-nucleotide adenylyltransferase